MWFEFFEEYLYLPSLFIYPNDVDNDLLFIENNNIKNVIVLSGDSHNAAMEDGTNAGLPEIMAGGLDITNSKTVALMQSFGINIWNKGGQGISTNEFNNAFGKITVFGADSVKLELIDEFATQFAEQVLLSEETTDVPMYDVPMYDVPINKFRLSQNCPNPFNPSTTIGYQIPKSGIVKIAVYNMLGQKVKTLVNTIKTAGKYQTEFNATYLSSGIYIYKMQAGNFTEVKKMLLLK